MQSGLMNLKLSNANISSDPLLMRNEAITFYTEFFSAADVNEGCQVEIFEGLPQLDESQAAALDGPITMEETTVDVQQLNSGRAPGIEGMPSDFYKKFWPLFGEDLHAVFKTCLEKGRLPCSCTRTVFFCPRKRI